MDADSFKALLAELKRGSTLHLRGSLVVPRGTYRVLAKRQDYVKLQKGSALPVELGHEQLAAMLD